MHPGHHARETRDRLQVPNVLRERATHLEDPATATPVTHGTLERLGPIARVPRDRRGATDREVDRIDRRVLATARPRR